LFKVAIRRLNQIPRPRGRGPVEGLFASALAVIILE